MLGVGYNGFQAVKITSINQISLQLQIDIKNKFFKIIFGKGGIGAWRYGKIFN